MCRRGFLVTSVVSFALFLLLTVSMALTIVHVEKTVDESPIHMTCDATAGLIRACVKCGDAALSSSARDCKPLFDMAWLGSFGKALWIGMALTWFVQIIVSLLLGGAAVFLWHTVLPLDAERVMNVANLELCLQITLDFAGGALLVAGYLIDSAVHGNGGIPLGAGGWLFAAAGAVSLAKYWTYSQLRAGSMELKRSQSAEADGELETPEDHPLIDQHSATAPPVGTVNTQRSQQQQQQPPVYAQPFASPTRSAQPYEMPVAPGFQNTVVHAQPIYAPQHTQHTAVHRDADDV
jgi:hypothetical protein